MNWQRLILIFMLIACLAVGCGRTDTKPVSTVTNSLTIVVSKLPATDAEVHEALGIPTNTVGLTCTNLTLRFEDMAGNERLKAFLNSIICARKPEGIYHWVFWSDSGVTMFNSLVIYQGHVTWYQRRYLIGEEPRARLIQEVDRSELLGAPQDQGCLRIHFNNGATQDVYWCVSVGA